MIVRPVKSLRIRNAQNASRALSRNLATRSCLPSSSRSADVGHSGRPLHVPRPRPQLRSYAKPSAAVTPTTRYRDLVDQGRLSSDSHQETIIVKLQHLHDNLISYTQRPTPPPQRPSFFGRFLSSSSSKPQWSSSSSPSDPKGLYLYGDVGTGKSMLMDLFYDTLPPRITKKRRVHFHNFMIDIHKALHKQSAGGAVEDAIAPVADALAKEVEVLCFDEFQVVDIVDAMILRRLLERLIDGGVILVMTSNRHPDELYKNGIQRDSFIPAIELLKNRLLVTDLNSHTDYRKTPRALSNAYFSPITDAHRREFDKLFGAISGSDVERDRKLLVWGRHLVVPESGNGAARFTFDELCGSPLSAADYIEVTREFPTIFIQDIPHLGINTKDKARRFITFIDACYESKTKLFTLSEVPIFEIFSDENVSQDITDQMRHIMDDLGLSSDIVGASSMFTGDEEIFAFARACSRLVEMGSKDWADRNSDMVASLA